MVVVSRHVVSFLKENAFITCEGQTCQKKKVLKNAPRGREREKVGDRETEEREMTERNA